MNYSRGITLVELLIVVAISALLVAGMTNLLSSSRSRVEMSSEEAAIVHDFGILFHKLNTELHRSLLGAGPDQITRISNSYKIFDGVSSLSFDTPDGEVGCVFVKSSRAIELTAKGSRNVLFGGTVDSVKFAIMTAEMPDRVDRFCIAMMLTVSPKSFKKPVSYLVKFFPKEAHCALADNYWVPVKRK